MKFHGIDMRGKFHVQRVSTLPVFESTDKGRLIYVEDEDEFYFGGTTEWKKGGGGTIVQDDLDVSLSNSVDVLNSLSRRNKIINGNFDIWQRGDSFNVVVYGPDRWFLVHAGSSKVASKQAFTLGQTDVSGNPSYFLRHVVTSVAGAANYTMLQNRIESVATLAGKKATLSFYAKVDSNKNIAIEFSQVFGTGGTPSTAVHGIGSQLVALTTSWKKYIITVDIPSIAGKILGTNLNDFLQLNFWFEAGSDFASRTANLGQRSGTFDIAQVQLEEGEIATPFEERHIAEELALCQRYYYKAGASYNIQSYGATSECSFTMQFSLPVVMRVAPTMSFTWSSGILVGATYDRVVNNRTHENQITSNAPGVFSAVLTVNYADAEL